MTFFIIHTTSGEYHANTLAKVYLVQRKCTVLDITAGVPLSEYKESLEYKQPLKVTVNTEKVKVLTK